VGKSLQVMSPNAQRTSWSFPPKPFSISVRTLSREVKKVLKQWQSSGFDGGGAAFDILVFPDQPLVSALNYECFAHKMVNNFRNWGGHSPPPARTPMFLSEYKIF